MQKNIQIWALSFLCNIIVLANSAKAQTIKTGSTDNSLLANSATVGVDITAAELDFNITNQKKIAIKPSNFVWGINCKGKNTDGLSSLFQGGQFTPSSSLNGIVGYSFSNSYGHKQYYTSANDSVLIFEKNNDSLVKQLYDEAFDSIPISKANNDMRVKIYAALEGYEKSPETMYAKFNSDTNVRQFIIPLINDYESITKAYDSNLARRHILLRSIRQSTLSKKALLLRATVFGTGGINADQLNLFRKWDTTNLSNSFVKENFRGGNIGGGFNISCNGKFTLGSLYRYEEGNNSSLINSTTYTLTSMQSAGNQSEQSNKNVVAYNYSDYYHLFSTNLYIDLCYAPGRIIDSNLVVFDFYFRNSKTNNWKVQPETSTIGISTALFSNKGKFLGGLYIELPDIDQEIEKNQPTPQLKDWYNRMSFGIYGKVAFNSLRPALDNINDE